MVWLLNLLGLCSCRIAFQPKDEQYGLSPVIPIQSNTFESYIIDMSQSRYSVDNATYVINPVYNPPCQQLQVISQQFIWIENFVQNNGKFCPIYEWQPLYQPVYFYLSPSSIDLVIYNVTSKDVQTVEQMIQSDLTQIVSSIQCYSIFPINNQIQFAVDCNGTIEGEQTKVILIFDLLKDQETLVISNFTLNSVKYYQYDNEYFDQYINNCSYRITQPFKLINYNNTLSEKYIQYCPEDEDQEIYFNSFFIIYDVTQISPQNYSLIALEGNSSQITNTTESYNIKHIFINQMILRFNQDTWNIGIIFQEKKGLYKCQFNISSNNEAIWNHTYTFLEIFQPNQVKQIYNQNQDFVLIFWNNLALYLIYFEQSWKDNNYQLLNFKNISQLEYYVIDITVTINYFIVIFSKENLTQSFQSNRRAICYNNISNFSNETNILKVYQNFERNSHVYYQQFINSNQQFLQPSSTYVKDQFTLFHVTNDTELTLEFYTITVKQISFRYFDASPNNLVYCTNITVQPYLQIIVEYNVTGLNAYYQKKYLVICLNLADYQQPQLIAEYMEVDFNTSYIGPCPRSRDIKKYTDVLNSLSLIGGIIGPLLKIYYIPNPTYNQYYPFYYDYQYKIPLLESLELLDKPIYRIYKAVVEDFQEKFNIFSTLFVFLTLEENKIQIYQLKCAITSQQHTGQINKLALSNCVRTPYFTVNLLQKVDQMKQLDNYWFYSQYDSNSTQIVICIENECYFIQGSFNQMQTKQLDLTFGPQMNLDQYFSITFLEVNSTYIQFYQFKIQIQTSVQESPIIATQYNSFSRQSIIDSFKYTFITEEYLVVGFQNGLFQSIVKGSLLSYEQPIFSNFSVPSVTENLQFYENCQFGFFIVSTSRLEQGQKLILYWSRNSTFSQISEWIAFGNNYAQSWRDLPLYGNLISNKYQLFVSGILLYVPITTDYPNEITYLIYNLLDYSGGMLIDSFNITITEKDEQIFTMPVQNYYDILQYFNEVSFALVVTNKELFLYYLNSDPQFTFKLADQKNINNSLTLLINQPYTTPIFRNYSILYNFTAFDIQAPNQRIYLEITKDNPNLEEVGGYYIYMFLIQNGNFSGSITNYNYQIDNTQASLYPYNYKINNTEIVVYPSPYLQLEKYLGDYMSTINQYGLITQMISYDNPMYASLFKIDPSSQSNEYYDLILVLTNNYLLFYQKQSYKSNNAFDNCNYHNYTQDSNSNQSQCLLRIIKIERLNVLNTNTLTCRMQLNGLSNILIYCQTINTQQIKQDTQQTFLIIEFIYYQLNNKITITNKTQSDPQYCYCYFLDLQPFYYFGNNYQVIKHTYYEESTFFAIYLIQQINGTIQANLQLVLPVSELFKRSRDFSLLVQPTQLTILLLQYVDLSIVTVNLTSWEIMNQKKLIPEQYPQDQFQENSGDFEDRFNKIDYSDLSFVGVLNQTLDSEIQMGLVGKFNYAAEIQINLTSHRFKITYIFTTYLVCQTSLLQKPQFISYNNTVVYLVSLCLTHYFEYTGLQEEMTYIFDEPSTNIMYIMFFIRENNTNHSQPVYMLQPNVINLASLNILQYQIYYIKQFDNQLINNTIHQIPRYQPKILITNTTYFLMDYVIYSQQGYYLSIPEEFIHQQDELVMTVEAYNEYSSNKINYILTWPKIKTFNSLLWFYILCFVIGFIIIALLIYYLVHIFKRKEQFEDPEISEFYRSTLEKSIEMQKPRNKMDESHFDITLRQIFTKKKD